MAYLNKKRGQSTLEYAMLIIIIIAALITIQVYIKRGVQGGIKKSADDIGDQFSPGNTNVIVAEKVSSKQKQTFGLADDGVTAAQGVSRTELVDPEVTNSITRSVIVNEKREEWGGT